MLHIRLDKLQAITGFKIGHLPDWLCYYEVGRHNKIYACVVVLKNGAIIVRYNGDEHWESTVYADEKVEAKIKQIEKALNY